LSEVLEHEKDKLAENLMANNGIKKIENTEIRKLHSEFLMLKQNETLIFPILNSSFFKLTLKYCFVYSRLRYLLNQI